MTIICDRLSTWVCVRALQQKGPEDGDGRNRLLVMDGSLFPWRHRLYKALLLCLGIRVEEARFYADSLRLRDGVSPFIAAHAALPVYLQASAEAWLQRYPLLATLNEGWGRNTLKLSLMKLLYASGFALAIRISCAEAIAQRDGLNPVEICMTRPPSLAGDHAWPFLSHGNVVILKNSAWSQFAQGLKGLFSCTKSSLSAAYRDLRSRGRQDSTSHGLPEPALLLLQEDELSLDRTLRGQPHWLTPGSPAFPGKILVLGGANGRPAVEKDTELRRAGVHYLEPTCLYGTQPTRSRHPVETATRRATWKMLSLAVRNLFSDCSILLRTAQLFQTATITLQFCLHNNIRAFMTCENYHIQAEAMCLIGPKIGIRTHSYQYSNIPMASVLMISTSDIMFSFAPRFHQRWTYAGIGPEQFIDVGYLYDGAFHLVRERAAARRAQLLSAGVKCILCVFDENFGDDRYRHLTPATHWKEIRMLLDACLADKTLGIVLKPQFVCNIQKPADIDALSEQLKEQGRYLEFNSGTLRSCHFPAEAALVADFVIGDLIGGTAVLEAALTGTRSIMINPSNITSLDEDVYLQADVLYPNLAAALRAIADHRAGAPERLALGDWSGIIGEFDPYRDGHAAERTRKRLEMTMAAAS